MTQLLKCFLQNFCMFTDYVSHVRQEKNIKSENYKK